MKCFTRETAACLATARIARFMSRNLNFRLEVAPAVAKQFVQSSPWLKILKTPPAKTKVSVLRDYCRHHQLSRVPLETSRATAVPHSD